MIILGVMRGGIGKFADAVLVWTLEKLVNSRPVDRTGAMVNMSFGRGNVFLSHNMVMTNGDMRRKAKTLALRSRLASFL